MNGNRKPLTSKQIRWIGLAMFFLVGPLCSFAAPYLGGFIVLAGLYVTIRAKKLAAKYGAEEPSAPQSIVKSPAKAPATQNIIKKPVKAPAPELPVAPKYSRQWLKWNPVHMSKGQPARMQRALTQSIVIREISKKGVAKMQGAKGETYKTGFQSCSCPDFGERGMPCKHMYLLAIRYAGFDPIPYIIQNHVKPHPLRGFMNLGMFKVTGKNFETNRKNTKTLYAPSEAQAIQMTVAKYGLTGPITVEEVAYPEPSAGQKAEIAALGVYVPAGANSYDYAAANDRHERMDEVTITQEQWEYAAECGIRLSALAGETGAKEIFREHHKRWKK